MVGGHRLVPFRVVPWGLVTTRFTTITAFGLFAQEVGDRTLNHVAYRQSLLFQAAVTRWLSVEAELIGAVASGSDRESVVDDGANFAYGGRLRGTARLYRQERWQISAGLEGEARSLGSAVPRRVLDAGRDALQTIESGLNTAYLPGTLLRLHPAVMVAAGINALLGFQASTGLGYRSLSIDGHRVGSAVFDLAGGASFDFASLGADLVVLIGGRLLQQIGGPEQRPLISALGVRGRTRTELELAFYYAGRGDLDLGVSLTGDLGGGGRSFIANIVMSYYW